jgi:glyoxylase-like metal-dependent hydrolase (beta-lactamase superfamily II)
MRNLRLVVTSIAFVFTAATSYGQTAATSDPLAIGGKDTAWFMDRVGRPDTDSEPQAPFKIWTPGHTLGAAAYFITTQENGRTYQIVFGGPPGPISGDPKYDTRPEDAFSSYKALRAMNPDILITGHPQNLLKGKLDALWANKRPSPLALQPGQWAKMIEDSEANFKKRLAEAHTPAR